MLYFDTYKRHESSVVKFQNFSLTEFLKDKLEEHLSKNYDGKVKVVRAAKREGLIRTRLLGAKAAKGDVIIFLDSHCEATLNWLPPLLGMYEMIMSS